MTKSNGREPNRITQCAIEAIEVLAEIMHDKQATARERLDAATAILEHGAKLSHAERRREAQK